MYCKLLSLLQRNRTNTPIYIAKVGKMDTIQCVGEQTFSYNVGED